MMMASNAVNPTSWVSSGRPAVPAHLAEHEDDENAAQKGYVKGTDFSLPYFSQWSRMYESDVQNGLLRHVNCGYLSTHGVAPTLLALKQHAQSLCVLIHALNPTLRSAEIMAGHPTNETGASKQSAASGAADTLAIKYERNDAFDFLTDLAIPYTNDDPNHNKPLTGLVNEVRARNEAFGTSYHCPFAEAGLPRAKGEPQKPYANHHSLVMHANACLERLDHEFSSTGGLLSLLPTTEEHEQGDLTNARNSLLGQWLLFTQHLVARQHELERSYGNAIDALAGEAAIPYQHMAALGPNGRSGREMVFPQDRWVLVNAGESIFKQIHLILDKQEALIQGKEKAWRSLGVLGDRVWEQGRGGDYARGIVPVTIPTRYYRLAGQGHYTLFVVPAWENHPSVEYTRQLENKPTVVACPQPKYPLRATELEKKYDKRVAQAQKTERENMQMRSNALAVQAQLKTLERQNDQLTQSRDALLLAVGSDTAQLALDVQAERNRAKKAESEVSQQALATKKAEQKAERLSKQVEALMFEAAQMRVQLNRLASNSQPGQDLEA